MFRNADLAVFDWPVRYNAGTPISVPTASPLAAPPSKPLPPPPPPERDAPGGLRRDTVCKTRSSQIRLVGQQRARKKPYMPNPSTRRPKSLKANGSCDRSLISHLSTLACAGGTISFDRLSLPRTAVLHRLTVAHSLASGVLLKATFRGRTCPARAKPASNGVWVETHACSQAE